MKKTLTFALAGLFGLTVQAHAMSANAEIDTDGDGAYSMSELQVVYPDMSETVFATIDADQSGLIDMDEMKMAEDAALLPTTDG
ncbi:EF-hand domain-containing protein [Algirhabdus cladophorae]|uniref:EF-hand domain-containing protein n=1 Tax=Algirhabdus cladophorae TaxID=3377108 RepID=UPI003B845E8B